MNNGDNTDEVIDKIKRILRLANRAGTDGEANAAKAAAKRLADKSGIRIDDIEAGDSDISTVHVADEKWISANGVEIGYATAVLRRHFGVIVIRQINPLHRSRSRLSWVGTAINIEIAKYVFEILIRESKKAYNDATLRNKLSKAFYKYLKKHFSADNLAIVGIKNPAKSLDKRSFYTGWYTTIHDKLTRNPIRNDIEQFEAEKRDLERKFKKLQDELGITESNRNRHKTDDMKAVMMGMDAASKVNLSRPCEGADVHGRTGKLSGFPKFREITFSEQQ